MDKPKFLKINLLRELTEKLIQILKDSIEEAEPFSASNYEDSWKEPQAWNDVIKYLSEINHASNLPEVYLGLAKYFDLYSLNCFPLNRQSEIPKLVSQIVEAAWRLMQFRGSLGTSSLICGSHEDTACVLSPWRGGLPFKNMVGGSGWPTIPAKHAVNFIPGLSQQPLSGKRLIRIIQKNQCPDGNWWMLGSDDPKTKKRWRSDVSVSKKWNSGKDYVDFTIQSNESLNVWIGKASSQCVPNKTCILTGGGNQVWIDQREARRFKLIRKKKIWI